MNDKLDRFDDWQLLQEYAQKRSSDSFACLIGRYADFVNHTALRRCHGDTQLAEDVTQAVFIVLARSAGTLKPVGSLAGWLHRTTLYAASNILRARARQQRRDRRGARAEAVPGPSLADTTDEVSAAVEEELQQLQPADRDVLSLHYLEGRSIAETAAAIGIGMEAAKKRVARALHRLRERLARRGITEFTTTSALVTAATAIGVSASSSSAQAATQITQTVIAGGQDGSAFELATNVLHQIRLVALRKAAAAIAIGIALVAGGAGIALAQRRAPASPPAVGAAAPTPTSQPLKSVPLSDEIRQALRRSAEQIAPITMEWSWYYHGDIGSVRRDAPLAGADVNRRTHVRISWQDGKYVGSMNTRLWDAKAKQPSSAPAIGYADDNQYAFDGKTIYVKSIFRQPDGSPNETLSRTPAAIFPFGKGPLGHTLDAQFVPADYFEQIAMRLPVKVGDLQAHAPPKSRILELLDGEGAALTDVDQVDWNGRKLTRLRIVGENYQRRAAERADVEKLTRFFRENGVDNAHNRAVIEQIKSDRLLPERRVYVYWLDPQLNYAVQQWEEQYETEELILRRRCEDHQKIAGRDVYLPRKIINEWPVSVDGKPSTVTDVYEMTVLKLEPIAEDSFALTCTIPGSTVFDQIDGDHQIQYLVQKDGTLRALRPGKPVAPPATKK